MRAGMVAVWRLGILACLATAGALLLLLSRPAPLAVPARARPLLHPRKHGPHTALARVRKRTCLASLLGATAQDEDIAGIEVLGKSALYHAAGSFDEHILLVLGGQEYAPGVLRRAQRAGWRLERVAPVHPHVPHPSSHGRHRPLQDCFAKLHALNLTRCDAVAYMDADTVFVDHVTSAVALNTQHSELAPTCRLWAASAFEGGRFVDGFDTGVMVLRPNATEMARLLHLLRANDTLSNHATAEHGFLNAVYKDAWCRLDFAHNADVAVHQACDAGEASLHHLWRARPPQVIHFATTKPWARPCPPPLEDLCNVWARQNRTHVHPLTVVSAYYAGPAKHSGDDYAAWGAGFMRMAAPIVMFTDDLASLAALGSRAADTTHVIIKPPHDFHVAGLGIDWDAQLAADPERALHSAHQFRVWLEKAGFVSHAMRVNPFRSSHFAWVDYGVFREPAMQAPPWAPTTAALPSHKLMLLNISAISHHPLKRVGGGVLAGDAHAWRAWTRLFYDTLQARLAAAEFVGDDQTTLSSVADAHADKACVVPPGLEFGDPFFYLLSVLDGRAGDAAVRHCFS